jgi:cytochrome c-type biogenesis protein CcmF
MQVAEYNLTYMDIEQTTTAEKRVTQAEVRVEKDGEFLTTLFPQRNFHLAQQQPQSEIAIKTTPVEDLYLVVTGFDADGGASLRAFVNPLTWWIWAGAAVMLLGMSVLLAGNATQAERSPARQRETSGSAIPAGAR